MDFVQLPLPLEIPRSVPEYVYCGDSLTVPEWRGLPVWAVRRADGSCVRGRNGNMLVEDVRGNRCVVLGYHLRKLKFGGLNDGND